MNDFDEMLLNDNNLNHDIELTYSHRTVLIRLNINKLNDYMIIKLELNLNFKFIIKDLIYQL